MKVNNNSGVLIRALGDKDSHIKRVTQSYESKLEKIKDRVEQTDDKVTALNTLQNLVRNYTNSAYAVQNLTSNPFLSNKAEITTNDNGVGTNYIDVTLGVGATKGSVNVIVDRIATASKLVIQGPGNGGIIDNPNLDGTLTINADGVYNDVVIGGVDSITQIIANINTRFATNNVKAEAFAIKTNDGTFIEVRHLEAGVNALSVAWYPTVGNNADLAEKPNSYTVGTTAKITVDGVSSEQDTNVFKDILPGVTINAITPNAATKSQTVNVVNDPVQAATEVGLLVNSYNELSKFVSKMTEQAGKGYAETAVLHSTAEIRQAQDLLASFGVGAINTDKAYKSLTDIGIDLKDDSTLQDVPAGTKILKIDNAKLANAINNNFEDFTALFRGASNFTAIGGATSKLGFVYLDKLLPSNVLNKDITVTATIAGGNVNAAVDIYFDGNNYQGAFANGQISFPAGSPLESLVLSYDMNGAPNGNEAFTMKLTQGLADNAYYKSTALVDRGGLNGSVVAGVNSAIEVKNKYVIEQGKLEAIIKQKTAKINQEFDAINQMDIFNELMMQFVSESINPSD